MSDVKSDKITDIELVKNIIHLFLGYPYKIDNSVFSRMIDPKTRFTRKNRIVSISPIIIDNTDIINLKDKINIKDCKDILSPDIINNYSSLLDIINLNDKINIKDLLNNCKKII